jgi:hypothetical protein
MPAAIAGVVAVVVVVSLASAAIAHWITNRRRDEYELNQTKNIGSSLGELLSAELIEKLQNERRSNPFSPATVLVNATIISSLPDSPSCSIQSDAAELEIREDATIAIQRQELDEEYTDRIRSGSRDDSDDQTLALQSDACMVVGRAISEEHEIFENSIFGRTISSFVGDHRLPRQPNFLYVPEAGVHASSTRTTSMSSYDAVSCADYGIDNRSPGHSPQHRLSSCLSICHFDEVSMEVMDDKPLGLVLTKDRRGIRVTRMIPGRAIWLTAQSRVVVGDYITQVADRPLDDDHLVSLDDARQILKQEIEEALRTKSPLKMNIRRPHPSAL